MVVVCGLGRCRQWSRWGQCLPLVRVPPPPPQQTGSTDPGGPPLPELILREVRRTQVPFNESIRGAFGPTAASILYWTASGAWLRRDTIGGWERVCQGQLRGLLTVGEGSGSVIAVDTAAGAMFSVGPTSCSRLRELPSGALVAAAVTDSGVLTIQRHLASGARLLMLAASSQAPDDRHAVLPLSTAGTADVDWLYLAAWRNGAVLGQRHSPFHWLLLDPVGRPLSKVRSGQLALRPDFNDRFGDGRPGRWFALDPVELGDAFLQVLADGVTGDRIAQVFDSQGVLQRVRRLDVPIGFFALSRERRLIGVRRRGYSQELVELGYSWGRRQRVSAWREGGKR